MIVLKIIVLWILSGLMFNVIVEGFPKHKENMNRVKKGILKFDVMMGPIGWVWFTVLGIRKMIKQNG